MRVWGASPQKIETYPGTISSYNNHEVSVHEQQPPAKGTGEAQCSEVHQATTTRTYSTRREAREDTVVPELRPSDLPNRILRRYPSTRTYVKKEKGRRTPLF